MITPRRTTLTTVPGLRTLHRAIADACASPDVSLARSTAVLVPTRACAAQLRHTLETLWLIDGPAVSDCRAVVLPEILTRSDWYRQMLERGATGSRLLSDIEREVLLAAAARQAVESGHAPPFRMRPGLTAEMLALYDGIRRQQKSVDDFERLVIEDLEPRAEFDRGAERLLRQTRFLVETFRAFEQRVEDSGALDEHHLRVRLLSSDGSPRAFHRIVIAMGDRVSDPSAGLHPADFDLLSRLPRLEAIDVIATRNALLAGLGERLRDLLPGVEERNCGESEPRPALCRPALASGPPYFTSRDREEELRDIARRIKRDLRVVAGTEAGGPSPDTAGQASPPAVPRVAVVFRRPLPYVYLGRTVFESAGIQYQAVDALPLAAEPFAAALDLVFSAVTARFAREPLVQLLGSPQFVFAQDGREPEATEWMALDNALAEAGYLGDVDRLRAFAETATGPAARAAAIAASVALELAALSNSAPVSVQLAALQAFVGAHERVRAEDEDSSASARHLRARAAVLRILADLRAAAEKYDDPSVTLPELAASVRRWLESQTFTPVRGRAGVQLMDAQSARYGHPDHVHLAGLVAGDWPEPSSRNIFYPPFLLARLGWPAEAARLAAERAAFADLLGLARQRVSLSSFTLEDDSIVEASPLLEEIERGGFQPAVVDAARLPRVFVDEALSGSTVDTTALSQRAEAWVALRQSRSAASEPQFHGFTTAGEAPASARLAATTSRRTPATPKRTYTVTGIDRYLECPFKYFARSVLDLPEEATDEQGMSPKERGRFVHEVFRAFFAEWQSRGGAGVSVEQLDAARTLFTEIAGERLSALPQAEASIERMRLLGSVAAPGLGEIVLAAEAVRPTPVTERLLEYSFEGEFALAAGGVQRSIRLRGKADRVDLLADGQLRIIDYKIGRAPDESIQLPVYALCLRQHLQRMGRAFDIGEALYIAFGSRRRPVEAVLGDGPRAAEVLEEAQGRVLSAVEGIERGEFPPRPASARLCGTCAYAAVCRKDYVVAD